MALLAKRMEIEHIHTLIDKNHSPESSDVQILKKVADEYPYFQAVIFAYLKALYIHDIQAFDKELKRLSIGITDRKSLFYHIFSEEYKEFFAQSGKKKLEEDKTSVLLNAFFETRNIAEPEREMEYTLEETSVASSDYLSYLNATEANNQSDEKYEEQVEGAKSLKHQNIIDSFLEKSKEDGGLKISIKQNAPSAIDEDAMEEQPVTTDEELNEDVFFTETLAKIYIKQKKYEKAYKIIKHLSLNYPKKNIYFADQLNFLEKLIINSKFKDKK